MVVLNPKVDPAQTASKIEKFLKDAQAEGVKVEKLGRKDLAYTIKKQKEADYYLFNFDAPGDGLRGVTDKIRLEQEAVLRYLVIKAKAKDLVKRQKKVAEQEAEQKTKVTVKTVTPSKTATPSPKLAPGAMPIPPTCAASASDR